MKSITIVGQLRTESGKKATRQLRSQKLVPGVIYGGKTEINFAAPAASFKSIVYTSEFMLANVVVEGKNYSCILKDLRDNFLNRERITVPQSIVENSHWNPSLIGSGENLFRFSNTPSGRFIYDNRNPCSYRRKRLFGMNFICRGNDHQIKILLQKLR